jgi:hypothetical protein
MSSNFAMPTELPIEVRKGTLMTFIKSRVVCMHKLVDVPNLNYTLASW